MNHSCFVKKQTRFKEPFAQENKTLKLLPSLPRERSFENNATAVLADEALLSFGQAFLPFPQLDPSPVLDAAVHHVVYGLVVLHRVRVRCHAYGLPLVIVTRSLRRGNIMS